MSSLAENRVFNNPKVVVESWYWAIPSHELKTEKIKHLNFLGKELAVYRGRDGKARAMDAYCPHMGAHLAEGTVDGNGVKCFFHHWKFDESGTLVDIPCRKNLNLNIETGTYPVEEKYGMIWIYTGKNPKIPVHYIPELKGFDLDSTYGNQFNKNCHPNLVMINAIDAHHFTSVHNFPVEVKFETKVLSENTIAFENQTFIPKTRPYLKFFAKFYKGALRYNMCYTSASTGSVTVGPDFLHCHIIFALRPTKDGGTEGQTLLVTKKRKGLAGFFLNPIILWATKQVGNYFAKGDTRIFETIKFKFNHPIKEDDSIIKFIQHAEKMETCDWGFGVKVEKEIPKLEFKEDVRTIEH